MPLPNVAASRDGIGKLVKVLNYKALFERLTNSYHTYQIITQISDKELFSGKSDGTRCEC